MMTDFDSTLAKYDRLIRSIAKSAITGSNVLDIQDLIQVGRMAAVRAIESYDSSYGASMRTHVSGAVRNAIYTEAAKFIGPMTIADHVITSHAAFVSNLHDEGLSDEEIASRLSRERLRWECSVEYARALRFLYQKRHCSELSESLVCGSEYVTEDAILQLLSQLETTPLEYSIIYDLWLGNKTKESLLKRYKVSRKQFAIVQRELKKRLYDLLQDQE